MLLPWWRGLLGWSLKGSFSVQLTGGEWEIFPRWSQTHTDVKNTGYDWNTWQPGDRDGGLRWQSQRQRSKSRLRSRGQGDRPHPQHQPEENSQIWGLRWVKFLHIACFEQFLVFYQDEGVDTSLLAAEAGCACCSESWNGGNDLLSMPFNFVQ